MSLKLEGWGCASWGIEKQQSTPRKGQVLRIRAKTHFISVNTSLYSVKNCARKSFLSNKLEKKNKFTRNESSIKSSMGRERFLNELNP